MLDVEWDPAKAAANVRKHGLSFEEACELFKGGADYLELYDDAPEGEDRFIAIGTISRGVILVVFTEVVEDTVRLISAREALRKESLLFHEYQGTMHE